MQIAAEAVQLGHRDKAPEFSCERPIVPFVELAGSLAQFEMVVACQRPSTHDAVDGVANTNFG